MTTPITRKENLRLDILREAIICRDPVEVPNTADARAVTDELLKRQTADVTAAADGTRRVTMRKQPNDTMTDAMRAARQVLLWLERGEVFTEKEMTERLGEVFTIGSIRRGLGRIKLLGLIDTNHEGHVTDLSGTELRPANRDLDTIGDLGSLINGVEVSAEPAPEPAPEPVPEPTTEEEGEPEPAPQPEPDTEQEQDAPEQTPQPEPAAEPSTVLVTTDDMTADEIKRAFEARYATDKLRATTLTYLAGVVTEVRKADRLVAGSDLWQHMDQRMGGRLWDFVRALVAKGTLTRTTDESGAAVFTFPEKQDTPVTEPVVEPADAEPAEAADAESPRLVLTDDMTPEATEAKFREVYAHDDTSAMKASENIHAILAAMSASRLAVDSARWKKLDQQLDGVLWDYIRALRADGLLKEHTPAVGMTLFEYVPPADAEQPAPEPAPEVRDVPADVAERRDRLARESLENLEQAQREADIAAGVVEPKPAPKKRGLGDLIERRLDGLDHKVNRIGEMVREVYDIHQRTSNSVEAQLLRDADPFVVDVLKMMVVHLHNAPGNMMRPRALYRKMSAAPKAGGASPRDIYDLAYDLGLDTKVIESVDGGVNTRLVDYSLLMSTTELRKRLARSENYSKGKAKAWITRKAGALINS